MRSARTLRLLAGTLIILLHSRPSYAEDVSIPAPEYTASYDISLAPIGIEAGTLLTGLDYPEEWVEYHFNISGFGIHHSRILLMGALNVPFSIRMTLTADVTHMVQQSSFEFVGTGFT